MLALVEKILSYVVLMRLHTERLVGRLQRWQDEQPNMRLSKNEKQQFLSLRESFRQHVQAFLALMAQLSHVAIASTSFKLLLVQLDFNQHYNNTKESLRFAGGSNWCGS